MNKHNLKNKIITTTIIATMCICLSGCNKQETDSTAQQTVDYTTGTPWLDIDLEGNVTADTPTDIKDNYALAVNKENILKLEIPEGYSYAGTIVDVYLKGDEDMKNMFLNSNPQSHDAKLAVSLFELMMDWDSRNKIGVEPLKKLVELVEIIDSIDALSSYFVNTPTKDRLFPLWAAGADLSLDDSTKRVLMISTTQLLLEDSQEYKELTDYGKIIKEAKEELAKKMLVKLGYTEEEALKKIEHCEAFETSIADSISSSEDRQKPEYIANINNHYSREDLLTLQANIPIIEKFEKAYGYPEADDYVVMEPKFIERLNEVYTQDNLELIKDYLIVHGVLQKAEYLDRESYEWANEASNAISGSSGLLEDAIVFSNKTAETLIWPTSRLYTETYLKQEDKDRITKMVDDIIETYHDIINEADFLSDQTRKKAIEKLEAIDKKILYPDSWDYYSCEDLNFLSKQEGGTLWDAINEISLYNVSKDVKDFTKPVNKDEWAIPPFMINCAYSGSSNSIYILGAFAQGGLYNSEMSDEELYAKTGNVIAHEISHAFDSKGSQFDKDGNLNNWWTEEDLAAFKKKNEKMAAYYSNMHPWAGQDFKGSIMTGEACADMAGMKCMLKIAAKKENFDYDKFFRSFANIWLTKSTIQRQYIQINDVHPMFYLRINATLQQYDEFLEFYGIKEGDNMYLAPDDRVTIW